MKTKIFTFFTVAVLLSSFALPAFASSSAYSFTMEFRVVNGKNNGIYHSLSSGSPTISGSTSVVSSKPGAFDPYDIKYTLYKDNFFGDTGYGTVNGGVDKYFTGTFDEVDGGDDYYLLIWRTNDDGNIVEGSGTVSD
ncbi:hypothetical protein [Paraliobacillus ryukyuensis]|uniref:hypothetical protein n=1 Tax=Paraliobacillus ryukyuensis TaxID=200904 RepID=UPI0009A79AEB|nr:hypothetical protein [Paraliobacillus ryukyuensis]